MLAPLRQNNLSAGGTTPIFSTCLVVSLLVDVAMTPATMVASGGDGGPFIYSAIGLPTGLHLSSGGTLSGTPTQGGTFAYQVSIGDSSGNVTVYNCSLSVAVIGVADDGFGIIRYLGDISNAEVLVTADGYGDLVQVDGIHTFDDFGIIGPCYRETLSLRIEYRRRGKELSEEQPFEIPDRYTTYLRHYVLARALEREGPGQDLVLSAHFQSRWEAGIARMMKRKNAMSFQKAQVMGGSNSVRGQKPPRPRLPWQFGTVVK